MPTAMPPAKSQRDTAIEPSGKPCHNCRRRRLRCDRGIPHCSKCEARGVECLGYGQLFLWTGAVATRGKLAGRTSSAALYKDKGTKRKREDGQSDVSAPAAQVATCEPPEPSESSQEDEDEDVTMIPNDDTQLVCVTPSASSGTSAPWTLVDPLFQDMTYSRRQYLAYFSSRLCLELVGEDLPSNPFRNLVPMTKAHPILEQVIVAASAAHMCNHARPFVSANSFTRDEAPARLLMDALVAKQRALQMMPGVLQSIETIGGDVALAAALFLVVTELIESGKHGWKPHLHAAGRIMKMIQPLATHDETLRDSLMSDCFVYYILGAAIHPEVPDPQTFFHSRQARAVLEKTANSYFCCPPEVLEILLLASQLCNHDADASVPDDMVTSAAVALFQRAHNYDVLSWARKVREIPSLSGSSIGSRFRAASAHRLATCLYITQAVPSLQEWLGEGVLDVLIDNFYHSLESIPPTDPNHKATAWPTFIYGSMVKTPERRAWVVKRFKGLCDECPWGFLYTAMDTLQLLWKLEKEGKLTKGWLQTLRDPDLDLLIV